MTKHFLNCSVHVAIAALCLGAMINGTTAGSFTRGCAARDLQILQLIEQREETNAISAERLSDALARMMNARMICYDGHVVDALTIYDGVARSLTPNNLSQSMSPNQFAIPINMVRLIADQLLKYGEVRRGRLGLTFNDPTPALIRSLKLSVSVTAPVIVKVEKGSPAEGAGLKAGDVVSELARISVRDRSDLSNRMGRLSVGDVADFTVVRNGEPMIIRATITDQEKNIRSK